MYCVFRSRLVASAAASALFVAAISSLAQMPAQAPAPATSAKPSAVVPAPSGLPATQATTVDAAPVTPPLLPQHVEVALVNDKLTVAATNASLNQILREVSKKTGIKIVGGVTDERVFGNYGPSTPAVVLAALLDGTESNMLLVDDAAGSSQLILTPRHGGATPPSPNAGSEESDPNQISNGQSPNRGFQPAGRTLVGEPNGGLPAPPPDDAQSPDSSKTPQQIYDQLQKVNANGSPQ